MYVCWNILSVCLKQSCLSYVLESNENFANKHSRSNWFSDSNSYSVLDMVQGWIGWVVTNHKLYSSIISSQNCFHIQSQENKFLNLPGLHALRSLSKNMLRVLHTRCKLGQHFINPFCCCSNAL